MTKKLITTSALAALMAATAFTPAFAQMREAADQPQSDRTSGAYVDDLIIGAAPARAGASNGGGLHVTAPPQVASEFARTLTPNSGGEQAAAETRETVALGHAEIIWNSAKPEDDNKQRRGRPVPAGPDQRDDAENDPEAAALLLPAVQSAREAARRETRPEPQANAVMPHHTTLDDLRPSAESQAGSRPQGEWSRVLNTGAQQAGEPLPVEELTLGYTEVEWTYARGEERKPESENDNKQRRVRTTSGDRNCQAAASAAAGVDDGLDTDSDGCAAAMQAGRGRARARATINASAAQEGGGLWNGTGPAAASEQGGGGIFNNGGVIGAAARGGDTLDDCDEVNSNPATAASSGGDHTDWIELDSTQAAAHCAGEGEGELEVDADSEIHIVCSRVRRGMQDLKN
jgi:type VI protein secretion system component Hcp